MKKNNWYVAIMLLILFPFIAEVVEDVLLGVASIFGILLTITLTIGLPIWFLSFIKNFIEMLIGQDAESKKQRKSYAEKTKLKKDFSDKQQKKQKKAADNEEKVKVKETSKKENKEKDFISIFNHLDVLIEHDEISRELVRAQDYLSQIKKIENEFPETKEKTRKLYSYYLPMLEGILNDYLRLLQTPANNEELLIYEDKLAKTVRLVNGAMETISVDLCQQYYDNMNVDIKTLEALLRKDGLVNEMNIPVPVSKED